MQHVHREFTSRATAMVAALLVCACAPRMTLQPSVTYRSPAFDGSSFSGLKVLILPVFTGHGFDTSAALSPARQAEVLLKSYPGVEVAYCRGFEDEAIRTYGKPALVKFYSHLEKGETAALQTGDSLWGLMDADLLFTTRVRDGLRIRSFARQLKRTVTFEAEVWNIDSAVVLWRAQVTGGTFDSTITDGDFLWRALVAAMDSLPVFRPGMNEKGW